MTKGLVLGVFMTFSSLGLANDEPGSGGFPGGPGEEGKAKTEKTGELRDKLAFCVDNWRGHWRINGTEGVYTYSGRAGSVSGEILFKGTTRSLMLYEGMPVWNCNRRLFTYNWICRGAPGSKYAGWRMNLNCYF